MPGSDFSLVWREFQKAREGDLLSGAAEKDSLVSLKKVGLPFLDNQPIFLPVRTVSI